MKILEPIGQSVCEVFGIAECELRGKSRLKHVSEARHAFVAKAWECGRFSMRGLGVVLGVDDGTIKNSITRARELREIDPAYNSLYLKIAVPNN